nr:uracil-DNA glycosylase family protein [Brucella intermedia]
MMDRDFIKSEIDAEYAKRRDPIGWRLLSCPWRTISEAKIVFLGLNPGGNHAPTDHPDISVEHGSAYTLESWGGYPTGKSPLQLQVLLLFRQLGIEPEHVLTGNLVPFRSPSWKSLKDSRSAMAFGLQLWDRILTAHPRQTVIAMGGDVFRALADHYAVQRTAIESMPANWGKVRVFRAHCGRFRLVGLPHLSRFTIIGREKSKSAVEWALADDT